MDAHLLAKLLATGRIGIGLALFLAPSRAAHIWLGDDAALPATSTAVRGLGARDVALGMGTLIALRSAADVGDDLDGDRDAERWLEAGIVADLADAAATLLPGRLGPGQIASVGIALSGVAIGATARAGLR